MAMLGMAIMQKYYGALQPATLRRVHAAAWRPREAGGLDASGDSVVPAISRVYFRSLPLRVCLPLLWLIGMPCAFAVAFDGFEAGSTQEWVASVAAALVLPLTVCNGASLNAKTVRALLTEFQMLYVMVNVLGFSCLLLFLLRDHPAKMVAFGLVLPSLLLAGLQDAWVEGGRVLNSRVFFTLTVASYLLLLALVSLELGAYTDYTFELSTFAFVASSMVCSTITTLLVFGCKNLGLSFYRPGSLVVLVSTVCCVFLDADTLAVLKAAYSLQGQTLGKHKRNKTVERQLKKHKKSIMEAAGALMLGASGVKPAPATNEPRKGDAPPPASSLPPVVVVEDAWDDPNLNASAAGGVGAVTDVPRGSGAGGCAPFDLRAGPERSER
jgi:hypothetical protein